MVRRSCSKRLLVEGREEQRVIPELIEQNGVPWGETRETSIVFIDEFNGVDNLLKPGVIEAELKSSGLKQLGIVVDADDDLEKRWATIRSRCNQAFPELPKLFPSTGLIAENDAGIRVGVWIMPDNRSSGMLETFLGYLVPNTQDNVYIAAQRAVADARALGAPCIEAHVSKANIYTWLAWQDPPGRQLHQAVMEQILNPSSPFAQPFVSWFRKLYEL